MQEKRRLHRIENKFGTDLTCVIKSSSRDIVCSILDFNSLGLKISCASQEDVKTLLADAIHQAVVTYGTMELGVFRSPNVLRAVEQGLQLVLLPESKEAVEHVERENRSNIPELLEPIGTGPDPVRLKETVVLRVENISESGFRAKCSLSNRHLMVGQKLKDFSFYFPSLGGIKGSFTIANVHHSSRHLHIGCRFDEISDADKRKIKSFLLLCLLSRVEDSEKAAEALQAKKISSVLRVRRIDSKVDFASMLQLRFDAYNGANKLMENATVEDMQDEFDLNSILLGAFVGRRMVGTMRIIFSKEDSKFPFEKYFEFPTNVPGLTRDETIEISKLAIDPKYQGSDVLFRLFQSFALEFIPKKKFGLLMSTDALARNYVAIGARRVSKSQPHPVVKTEKLCLYLLETSRLKIGKMSALAWLFFAREIIDFMSNFGFTKKTKFPAFKYLLLPLEISAKVARKLKRRIFR